jgi:hypothetical protein
MLATSRLIELFKLYVKKIEGNKAKGFAKFLAYV